MKKTLKSSEKYVIMEGEDLKKQLYEDMVKRLHQRQVLADVINWEHRFKTAGVPDFVMSRLIKPYEVRVIHSAKARLFGGLYDAPLTSKQTRVLNEVLTEIGRRIRTQYHAGNLSRDHHYYKAQFDMFKKSERKKAYDYIDTAIESQIVRLEGWVVD